MPKYLTFAPAPLSVGENLDFDIIREISEKFQVEPDRVVENIKKGATEGEVNEFLVAYDLIYDNKRIYSQEKEVTPMGITPVLSSSQNQVNLREETPFDVEDDFASATSLVYSDRKLSISLEKRKMWLLGMVSSQPPKEIMKEVFRALKTIGFVRIINK